MGKANTFLGYISGFKNTTGSYNTILGNTSGFFIKDGSGNVIIGRGAGPTDGQGNQHYRLYIDADTSSTDGNNNPLIYGEFDNDFVRINGTFEVTAGLMNPSSRSLKSQFVAMDASTILAKLMQLDVTQWHYTKRPDEKHIGPVAEDFYALFGLGQGDKTISTIDADGVMMLSIQALKKENEEIKKDNLILKNENLEMKERLNHLESLVDKLVAEKD